jgi:integrase
MATSILFTKQSLAAIKPNERRTYYQDTRVRGLLVDVLPSGIKSFQVYRKFKGRPLRVALGRFSADLPDTREFENGLDPLLLLGNAPTLNVKMARAMAQAVNAELNKGMNPSAAAKKVRAHLEGEPTMRGAFDLYVKDYLEPHGKRTVTDLKNNFSRYLGKVDGEKKLRGRIKTKPSGAVDWENKKLSSIEPSDIRRLMNGLRDGVGAHTANRTLEMLRAIYNKMIEWKLFFGANPCQEIEKFHTLSRDRFVTGDEFPRFFEALSAVTHEDFKDFILLLLATGARKGNVLAMRWEDLNLDGRFWTIPGEASKNGEALTVPLTSAALEILGRKKDNKSDWVFPAKSRSGHAESFKKHWAALVKETGMDDLRLHDLRRSLGSWAAMTGASLAVIGKALGHKSVDATRIYARLQHDPVREAMERASAAMLATTRKESAAQVLPISQAGK